MYQKLKVILKWILNNSRNINITAKVCQANYNNILAGKNIIITGGNKGIGIAIARRCVSEGANILIIGRDLAALEGAQKELGDRCKILSVDLSAKQDMTLLINKAVELLGGNVDCLVNNAGISIHNIDHLTCSEQDWDRQMDLNLKSIYFLTQAFVKHLEETNNSNGNILMISSERGLYCDVIPYGLTKVALNSFTQGLARRLIKQGIRVNALAPGVTASDMTGFSADENLYRPMACGQRVLLPEEIAEVALFMLSDLSRCISGEVIACNEGNHLRCDW